MAKAMKRTQVYLTQNEHIALAQLSRQTKQKRSEIIREAIDEHLKTHGDGNFVAAIAATAQLEKLQLVTLNRKHFPMFTGLKRPY